METKVFNFRIGKIIFKIFQTGDVTVAKPYQQQNGKMVVSEDFFGKTKLSHGDTFNSRIGVKIAILKCLKMMSKIIISEHNIQIRRINDQYQEMTKMLDSKINRLEKESSKKTMKEGVN